MNLNLWITPDSANLDAQSGGLIVYKQQPPLHWNTDQTNNMGRDFSALRSELEKGQVVRVPFKRNRMVIFTSNLWHETMPFKFKTQCALLGLGRSITYAVDHPAHYSLGLRASCGERHVCFACRVLRCRYKSRRINVTLLFGLRDQPFASSSSRATA